MTLASSHSTITSNMRALLTTVKRSRSDHEEDGFRVRIEKGQARFEMKDDQPTVDSALELVNSYISNWELDAALMGKPNEFKLKFVGPEVIDRNPTRASIELMLARYFGSSPRRFLQSQRVYRIPNLLSACHLSAMMTCWLCSVAMRTSVTVGKNWRT